MQGNPWDVSDILLSNRSGQLLGQGVAAAGQGIAAGIREYQQQKQLATEATAKFEGLMQQDPTLLQQLESGQAPKDVSTAYSRLKKAGTASANDATLLSGYAETILNAKQRQQQATAQQAQAAYDQQRTAALAQQLSQDRSNRAAFQQTFGGLPTATDASMYLSRSGPGYTPGSTVQPQQPQPTAADADSVLRAYAKAGGDITPELGNLLARMDANAARRETARRPAAIDVERIRSADAKGNPIEISVDKATGRELGRGPVQRPVLAPDEQGKAEFAKSLNDSIGKQVADVLDKVPNYQSTIEQVQRGRAALSSGATTGGLADIKLRAAQTLNGIAGTQLFNTAPTELAKSSFSDMALTAASRMKSQGQISDSERKLLSDTVAQMGNSPQALGYIMNFMEAAAQRNLAKAGELQKLQATGELDSSKYSQILATWEKDHPIDLQSVGAAPGSKADDLLRKYGIMK